MNRIDKLFNTKKEGVLSVYFTAGYPKLNDTVTIISQLEESGVDIIEIGIPFSDPLADGSVIQKSSDLALKNGMNLKLLFEQLSGIRSQVNIPLVMMGYFNTILQFGVSEFVQKCKETGIDGLIVPDLPLDIYEAEYKTLFEESDLHNILLITPQTSPERVRKIDALSRGFLYMVSSSSITGTKNGFNENQRNYFKRIKELNLRNPKLIGFGISNNETYTEACKYAEGTIIGSAFINTLTEAKDINKAIDNFVKTIKQ